jgi:hypothetical protein
LSEVGMERWKVVELASTVVSEDTVVLEIMEW